MRFNTLDGLRGFAAILVLFFHLRGSAPVAAPSGYLAVDFFFALSGFVISHAYDARLRAGLTLREFAVLRLVRVYPMAFLGAAIGVLLSGQFFLSLLLIPDLPSIVTGTALYPANVPLWSLVLELVVNIAFAACAARLGWCGLLAVLALSAAILLIGASRYSYAGLGAFWLTAGYGLARTVFSFAVGIAMQRLHVVFAVRRRVTPLAWLLPLALVLLLTHAPVDRPAWDLGCVFVFLPGILWLGTIWEAPQTRLFDLLGGLSYPLYCIHGVFLQSFSGREVPPYLWIALITAAWWLNSRVDIPLRGWLMARWKRRRIALLPA